MKDQKRRASSQLATQVLMATGYSYIEHEKQKTRSEGKRSRTKQSIKIHRTYDISVQKREENKLNGRQKSGETQKWRRQEEGRKNRSNTNRKHKKYAGRRRGREKGNVAFGTSGGSFRMTLRSDMRRS